MTNYSGFQLWNNIYLITFMSAFINIFFSERVKPNLRNFFICEVVMLLAMYIVICINIGASIYLPLIRQFVLFAIMTALTIRLFKAKVIEFILCFVWILSVISFTEFIIMPLGVLFTNFDEIMFVNKTFLSVEVYIIFDVILTISLFIEHKIIKSGLISQLNTKILSNIILVIISFILLTFIQLSNFMAEIQQDFFVLLFVAIFFVLSNLVLFRTIKQIVNQNKKIIVDQSRLAALKNIQVDKKYYQTKQNESEELIKLINSQMEHLGDESFSMQEIDDKYSSYKQETYCDSEVLNCVLKLFMSMFKNSNVCSTFSIRTKMKDILSDFEMVTLFSNLLTNAYEALEYNTINKTVSLQVYRVNSMLFIECVNDLPEVIIAHKKTVSGEGLSIVKNVLQYLEGELHVMSKDNQFKVKIILPVNKD
ncbi:MAG: GHKL domain-containing protein [Anaerorhabdus sp.]|uniref:GHKL domain-containing protein n=1 Tax=Anaerorhabdus sp. TaxID=1872524 RepID=UPI002FCC25E7